MCLGAHAGTTAQSFRLFGSNRAGPPSSLFSITGKKTRASSPSEEGSSTGDLLTCPPQSLFNPFFDEKLSRDFPLFLSSPCPLKNTFFYFLIFFNRVVRFLRHLTWSFCPQIFSLSRLLGDPKILLSLVIGEHLPSSSPPPRSFGLPLISPSALNGQYPGCRIFVFIITKRVFKVCSFSSMIALREPPVF